jgi:Icc-related predicted phosphoesterase
MPQASGKYSGRLRVQLLSDIHAEMGSQAEPLPAAVDASADLILIPGDTAHAPDAVDVACRMFPGTVPIVLLAGNHEHYQTGMTIPAGLAVMRAAAAAESATRGRQVYVLENETLLLTIRGVSVRLAGCTMWSDYALLGNPLRDMAKVVRSLNDYRLITGLGGAGHFFSSDECLSMFAASRAFLSAVLAEPHDGPTIILTHHLPSFRSVARQYKKDPVSAGFASDLDDLISMGAALWVHGHTHVSCTWRDQGGTFVVCNPAGYARGRKGAAILENAKFDPKLIIDVRRGGPGRKWMAGKKLQRPASDRGVIPAK